MSRRGRGKGVVEAVYKRVGRLAAEVEKIKQLLEEARVEGTRDVGVQTGQERRPTRARTKARSQASSGVNSGLQEETPALQEVTGQQEVVQRLQEATRCSQEDTQSSESPSSESSEEERQEAGSRIKDTAARPKPETPSSIRAVRSRQLLLSHERIEPRETEQGYRRGAREPSQAASPRDARVEEQQEALRPRGRSQEPTNPTVKLHRIRNSSEPSIQPTAESQMHSQRRDREAQQERKRAARVQLEQQQEYLQTINELADETSPRDEVKEVLQHPQGLLGEAERGKNPRATRIREDSRPQVCLQTPRARRAEPRQAQQRCARTLREIALKETRQEVEDTQPTAEPPKPRGKTRIYHSTPAKEKPRPPPAAQDTPSEGSESPPSPLLSEGSWQVCVRAMNEYLEVCPDHLLNLLPTAPAPTPVPIPSTVSKRRQPKRPLTRTK